MEPLLGEIKMFAGNFAPNGWYTCEGQTLSISQNTALFSILGTTYGGDGMTTFKLPDLRGSFPTQCSNIGGSHPGGTYALGQIGGRQNITLTTPQLPPHTHGISAVTLGNQPQPNGNYPAGLLVDPNTGEGTNNWSNETPNATLNAATIAPAGGGQPVDVTPPFLAMQYIIAWTGIYPQRP